MAVVEELIGRLTLQTKGIKDAREAVKAMEAFRKALQGLAGAARVNFSGPANAAKGFKQVIEQAKKAAQAQKQIANSADFGRANAGLKQLTSTAERLRKAYIQAATAQRALARAPASTGRSWIQGEIDALRQYQRLQRQVNSEAGRRGISRAGAERGVTHRYGAGGGVGGGLRNPAPGVVDVRGLIDKGFDSATTVPQVQAQMRMRKESEADIKKATDLAYKLSGEVKQFTAAEHLQAIYQSLAVFGEMDKAIKAAPMMQRSNALIEGLADQYTRLKPFKGGTATKDFARIFDMMGVTENEPRMQALGESIIKVLEQSSGDISPSDILMALKYSRSAKYGFNADFLQNYLGGIIGDAKVRGGGASSAGSSLQNVYKSFHDLVAPDYILGNLKRLGLLKDPSKLEYSKKGKIKGPGTAEVVGRDLLRENPQKWATDYLLPVIEKNFGKLTGDDQKDASTVLKAAGQFTSDRVTKDAIVGAILQRAERERDANITRKMPGLEGLKVLSEQAPVSILQQFTAGVTDLFAALAAPAVQPALAAMKTLGDVARGISNFQRENPDAAPVVSGATGTAALGVGAGIGVVGRRMAGKLIRGIIGGGTTPGSGGAAPASPTTPVEPPGPTTSSAARPVVGPQMSAMDIAARNLAKAAAAAAIPVTTSLGKGEQDALVKRLGAYAQSKGYGRPAQTTGAGTQASTTPNPVAAAVPNTGAVESRLSEIQSSTQATADKMKDALSFTAKPEVDTGGIDAAISKAQQLKALLDGARSAAAGAAAGVSGAGLTKGSNSFTSAGATAP